MNFKLNEHKKALNLKWKGLKTIDSKEFICGYCGSHIASNLGWEGIDEVEKNVAVKHWIFICHNCRRPTYLTAYGLQVPGVKYGRSVEEVPKLVNSLYEEARSCTSANAFTASVLCCRKILMNIAVSKGDKPGKYFTEYIDYLENKNYIPPDGKEWVNHIRDKGNEATHKIEIMEKEDAEELISFVEMLLKFIYEFPEIMRKKSLNQTEEDKEI